MKALIFFFVLLLNQKLLAQIDLKKTEKDYFCENQNFKNKELKVEKNLPEIKRDNLIFSAVQSGISNWYSCSDSITSIFSTGNDLKISIQSSNNNCFGFSLDNQDFNQVNFLSFKSRFESKLPIDSIFLKISLMDKNKNQTGFIYQTVIKRGSIGENIAPVFLFLNSDSDVNFKEINSILFQIISTYKDPFWGAVFFESISFEK